MITATVEDTQMGKWLMLECQHPVKSGKHLILGGKVSSVLMESCGEKWWIGAFTDAAELADKVEGHVKSHVRGGDDPGDQAAEDEGRGPGDAAERHGDETDGNQARGMLS